MLILSEKHIAFFREIEALSSLDFVSGFQQCCEDYLLAWICCHGTGFIACSSQEQVGAKSKDTQFSFWLEKSKDGLSSINPATFMDWLTGVGEKRAGNLNFLLSRSTHFQSKLMPRELTKYLPDELFLLTLASKERICLMPKVTPTLPNLPDF